MPRIRVVGGLVPRLLITASQDFSGEAHVGTQDLDLGLELTLLDDSEYENLSDRLRNAGFHNDRSPSGRPTRQRWIQSAAGLTVDFLIPPINTETRAGSLQNLEHDFAAVVTPGLSLAFQDFEIVSIAGTTIGGEEAERDVWVCGPGAFVVLKALAIRNRAERKDAYDLHYMLQNWPGGLDDVADRIRRLTPNLLVATTIENLSEDFGSIDSVGARQLDRFLGGEESDNEELRADASALVRELIRRISPVA